MKYDNSIVILDTIELKGCYLYRLKKNPSYSWIDSSYKNGRIRRKDKSIVEVINGGFFYFPQCQFSKSIGNNLLEKKLTDSLRRICNESTFTLKTKPIKTNNQCEVFYIENMNYLCGLIEISFLYDIERWNKKQLNQKNIWIPFVVPINAISGID